MFLRNIAAPVEYTIGLWKMCAFCDCKVQMYTSVGNLVAVPYPWTMMEQRRALTIPFTVDKDKLVSWTAFADCKFRHRKSPHKNGSTKFDHSNAAMMALEMEMERKKPLLVLKDVLKTKFGMEYMERTKKTHSAKNRGQTPSRRRESGQCREETPTYRDTRSSQRETRNNRSKSVTPKRNQRTVTPTSQRLSLRRRPQNVDDQEDKEESKDIEEVIIGKDNTEDDRFAEVVDCGLSFSWEPVENIVPCDSIKDRWTDSEKDAQPNLKRKRRDSASQCNGTESPKRHCESVLPLTEEEEGRDGEAFSAPICHKDSREDGDLESLEHCIVQFTVGEDDGTEVLVPVINPDLEREDFTGSPRQSLSSTQDNGNQISPSEPIVLSSDDEEGGDVSRGCSQVCTLVAVEDAVIKGQSSQEAEDKQQHTAGMQVFQLVVHDSTLSVTSAPSLDIDYSCMELAFCGLHCGVYHGKANGPIAIKEEEIIIPLKDISEELEVKLTFERTELKRYSVWERQELEERQLHFKGDEQPTPAAVLLFCVSETAAASVQQDLCQLSAKKDGAVNTGKASPFILLTLREPLVGMEGALFRSLLDLVCLNDQTNLRHSTDRFSELGDVSPVLSLDDSIELIKRTGLDSFLLSMLGVTNTDTEPEEDKKPTAQKTDSVLETEIAPEPETEASLLKPKPDQEEQKLECPSDKEKEEPTPVYTMCHRRTRGSYSVSLCKPGSSWTKYKHQGLAHRLIQFPPPPMKGGITVTMEDLQCLDSGQYLNDVIIDFYLKYLLQNASASMVERSHIFSSFFYKQLTRRDNASEGGNSDSCQRQRRHQRVKTWTRHVDIFKKDFLFVPVNQEAHWYLVVICFPGLDEPKIEGWMGKCSDVTEESESQDDAQGSKSFNDDVEKSPMRSDNIDTETENTQEEFTRDSPPNPVSCTELTWQKKTVCKRPCILIMDSLKLSLHERVFKLLREYLQSEWEVRRGSPRDFGPDQMKSSHCHVPLQDNSSDCGLYLLQYVECFLKDPVVHFDLPLHLERWFPRQQVRRKRDEIRDLVLNLYRHQNLDNRLGKQLSG
ncbi:sentrin-specific protease 7 isoform X3 [Oreochromis aureus]|uniref:sentrin-specific protease 7 isoform X3 n=2 Tax=Oreochromis aureus TaxID=47969 RepID=UPI001952C06B|nr:sentrin-specific protease 7 isoform X3 [Oreochromis aureus]